MVSLTANFFRSGKSWFGLENFFLLPAWMSCKSKNTLGNAGILWKKQWIFLTNLKTKSSYDVNWKSNWFVCRMNKDAACPQVFSSGGTCTLLPTFLGVHPNFWGCNANSSFGGTLTLGRIFVRNPPFFSPYWYNFTRSNPAYFDLKSTCDVNLLSKLSIIFKEWRVMSNVDRGGVIVHFVL